MEIYPFIKMFVLAFMLGVYVLFLITIAATYYAGGWVVVMVNKYQEGTVEDILLSAPLSLATYVTAKEATTAYREIKKRKNAQSTYHNNTDPLHINVYFMPSTKILLGDKAWSQRKRL